MKFERKESSISRCLQFEGKFLDTVNIFDNTKKEVLFCGSAYDFIKPVYVVSNIVQYGGFNTDIEKIVIEDIQKKNKIDLSMKKCFYVSAKNAFNEATYNLFIPNNLICFEQIEDCLCCGSDEEEKRFQKQFKIKSGNGINFYHCSDEIKVIPRDISLEEAKQLVNDKKAYFHSNMNSVTVKKPLKLVEDGLCVSSVYKVTKTEKRVKEEEEAKAISEILGGRYVSLDSLKKIKELLKK